MRRSSTAPFARSRSNTRSFSQWNTRRRPSTSACFASSTQGMTPYEFKAASGTAEARRQQALRKEFEEQQRGDPRDLERRYEKQEKERAEREAKLREARERQRLEAEFEQEKALLSGFHFNDN